MKAGRLRHRVTLQQAANVVNDTTGGVARTWADLGSWWCEIRPASVREGLIDGGVRDEADVRLVGRRNSVVAGLRAMDRAVGTDGRIFNIAGPPMVGNRNDEVILRAKVGLNDG